MADNWQYAGNTFADAMMNAGLPKYTKGQPHAGIIVTLPKRNNWHGETMMDGVPVDPAGYGLTELDTDKFVNIFGNNKHAGMDEIIDGIGTKNLEGLNDDDFNHAMGAYKQIINTKLGYKTYEEMLAEGAGSSAAYAQKGKDGRHIVNIADTSDSKKLARVAAHEFDHVGEEAYDDQLELGRRGNAMLPHSIRPHEIRAANSASRALFDNRFTNPKSPWFIHPSLEVNNHKFGSLFGMVGPNISTDRLDMIQKMQTKVGRQSYSPTVQDAYKQNLNKERDRVQVLWDNDPDFREALSGMLQNGISH